MKDQISGLELTPRKVEYLKLIYENGKRISTKEIASFFGVEPSTVTKMIQELTQEGFLSHIPYHGVLLSEKGEQYAEFFMRRHRILSLILTHYGLSVEQACEEAGRFESFVSKKAIDTMCRSLGHPMTGVCGSIPHDTTCCPVHPTEKTLSFP